MANVQVFVYGTLRPPRPDTVADDSRYYFQIEQYVESAIPACVSGAKMYNFGSYPGVVQGKGAIRGDLLTVRQRALKIMDQIEGHPMFYTRSRVDVQTETKTVKAWIYWAPKEMVIGRPQIVNGDWLLRRDAELAEVDVLPPDPASIDATLLKLVNLFAKEECSWLSSNRPDGRAHSAPVWHAWHRGRIYVVTTTNAVKKANIYNNPSVVITCPDPVDPIIIEGWGTFATGMRSQLQPLFLEKYNWDLDTDEEYDTIIEITPTKLIAWGKHGEGRWPGTEIMQVWAS